MTDLTHEGVHRFWKEYSDPMIYRVVSFMEGVEDWTLDGNPEFEQAMLRFSEKFADAGNYELGKQDEFVKLCCNLKCARSLRLLQAMDTAHPGAASKLLIHAEELTENTNDLPGLFLRRNIVFERLRLLARVFAPERFALVLKALEGDDA